MNKTTFALFFGNRGFFPASLIASAREEMKRELNALGHEVLMLDWRGHALRRGRNAAGGRSLCQLPARQPRQVRRCDRLPAQFRR